MPSTISDSHSYIPGNHEEFNKIQSKEFMSPEQLAYFKKMLLTWRDQLMRESDEAIQQITTQPVQKADTIDLAFYEIDYKIEMEARGRRIKLIKAIDEALHRIEEGSYGYCEETGEPIDFNRLLVRPIATRSIHAQERFDKHNRTYSKNYA